MAFEPELRKGENAALALRHRLGLGDDAVELEQLSEQLGVHVLVREFGETAPDGMYFYDGDHAIAVINASRRPQRQRFTLAHELGHHELHRFDGPTQIVDVDVFGDGKDPDEVAANAFAAHLLLPRNGLLSVIGDRRNARVSVEDVAALVRRFRVSWEVACNRLSNENLIRQNVDRERLLNVQRRSVMRRHGITDAMFALAASEVPRRLAEDAALLWQQHVIADERLAQILERPVDEALALMREWGIEREPAGERDAERAGDLLAEHGWSVEDLLAAGAAEDEDPDAS